VIRGKGNKKAAGKNRGLKKFNNEQNKSIIGWASFL